MRWEADSESDGEATKGPGQTLRMEKSGEAEEERI